MAVGSEQFNWQVWPFGRECAACSRTLTIKQVREHRTYILKGAVTARYLICVDCWRPDAITRLEASRQGA